MPQLQPLKLQSDAVLLQELGILFIRVEGWRGQLFTPPWYTSLLEGAQDATSVRVVNDDLVVDGLAEGPDLILVEAVVHYWDIRVGRVRVERLALGVVEVQLLISVCDGQHRRCANRGTLLGHAWLQPLEVVRLLELDVIRVAQVVPIGGHVLVEPH